MLVSRVTFFGEVGHRSFHLNDHKAPDVVFFIVSKYTAVDDTKNDIITMTNCSSNWENTYPNKSNHNIVSSQMYNFATEKNLCLTKRDLNSHYPTVNSKINSQTKQRAQNENKYITFFLSLF